MMYRVGGLADPPGAGAVMDAIGPNGLPVSLAFLGFALTIFTLARK